MKQQSDTRFEKSRAKRQQQALLLASRPDFQADVIQLRKDWNIPTKGFKEKDHTSIEKWWGWLGEQDDKWHKEKWPKYYEELKQLEKDALAVKVPYINFVDRMEAINLDKPLNAFYNDIRKLRNKYELGPSWKDGLRTYIHTNRVDSLRFTVGVRMHVPFEAGADNEELHLVIDEDTTLADIKTAWPQVKFHQDKLSYRKRQRQRPVKSDTLEHGAKAYELHEIQKLNLVNTADELNDKYDTDYMYFDVSTLIKNYKKVVGM
jgi:hypothetical protein